MHVCMCVCVSNGGDKLVWPYYRGRRSLDWDALSLLESQCTYLLRVPLGHGTYINGKAMRSSEYVYMPTRQ